MVYPILYKDGSSRPDVFCEKGAPPATLLKKRRWHRCFPVNFAKFLGTSFLQNPSGGCLRLKACNFIKKETLTQVFSRELCEISKNTFFTEHLWAPASGDDGSVQ